MRVYNTARQEGTWHSVGDGRSPVLTSSEWTVSAFTNNPDLGHIVLLVRAFSNQCVSDRLTAKTHEQEVGQTKRERHGAKD